MRPLLYFSYGMTKTGSTLAFQLVRSALDLCGFPQDRVEQDVVPPHLKRNFVDHVSEQQLQALKQEALKRRTPIVLKTHMRPDPGVVKMIQSGEAIAHASYRDPRDMALSMLDHAQKSRAAGAEEFSELTSMELVMENIRGQMNSLTAWLRLPGVMPLYFEDLAFDTQTPAKQILDQLDLKLDPDVLADVVLNHRFTMRNKAVRLRHPTEMDPETSESFASEFAPLIDRFITNRHRLVLDGRVQLPPPQQLRTSAKE